MTTGANGAAPRLQFGKACRPYKGEDRVFAFELANDGGLLVGVADGVSTADGDVAAGWIEKTMHEIASSAHGDKPPSARDVFKHVNEALARLDPSARTTDSLSTLSCGVCRIKNVDAAPVMHFDFFGVGDSPMWRVAPLVNGGDVRFQASVVYESPTPREEGMVYGFVSLKDRRIEGRPHFGSVDLAEDELLVLASDGVPEWQIFGADQDPAVSKTSPKLIDRVLDAQSLDDAMLNDLMLEYDRQKMLIDDDASIAVVRWRHVAEVGAAADVVTRDITSEMAPDHPEPASAKRSLAATPPSDGELDGTASRNSRSGSKKKYPHSNQKRSSSKRKKRKKS